MKSSRSMPLLRSGAVKDVGTASGTGLTGPDMVVDGLSKERQVKAVNGLMGSLPRSTSSLERTKPTQGIKARGLNKTEVDAMENVDEKSPITALHVTAENDSSKKSSAQKTSPQPNSKSKKILRRLTNVLRLPLAAPATPLPRIAAPPALPNSFASKEQREAALRERGLLPPLRPNPDLSVQEQKQDEKLTIAVPPSEDPDDHVTAAEQIKQEWEARHNHVDDVSSNHEVDERERFNRFKFGTGSPISPGSESQIPSPPEPTEASRTDLPTIEEGDTPLPSPNSPHITDSNRTLQPPNVDVDSSDQMLRSSHVLVLPSIDADLQQACSIPIPPSPIIQVTMSNALEAWSIPLPPSPLLAPGTLEFSPSDPLLIPLPASPINLSPPPSPKSTKGSFYGAATPKALPSGQPSSTPKMLPFQPQPDLLVTDLLVLPTGSPTPSPTNPSFTESESVSNSSIATPSLHTEFNTYTIATSSSSSDASLGIKMNALKIKSPEYSIPVILESPVETSDEIVPLAKIAVDVVLDKDLPDRPSDNTNTDTARQPRIRAQTDPVVSKTKHDRRKSFGLFRRGDNTETGSVKSDSSSSKKLSVAASISNIRRSVIGTLLRNKSNLGAPSQKASPTTMFDASHLPPSPTLPKSLAEQAQTPQITHSRSSPMLRNQKNLRLPTGSPQARAPPAHLQSLRQPLMPTMYSRGSILLETAQIEDEESRRLSELAFCG